MDAAISSTAVEVERTCSVPRSELLAISFAVAISSINALTLSPALCGLLLRKSKERTGGDCIDCGLCVTTCPTGIDIRNGLQMECIGCAQCIDACDGVMAKQKKPLGLIRYTSEHELKGGTTHWLRPRIIGYMLVLCLMVGVFWYNVFSRVPVELTVIRDRNQLYVTTDNGDTENIYTLNLVNMDREIARNAERYAFLKWASRSMETLHVNPPGTGIMHSEFNPQPDAETHLLQIWIFPEQKNLEPSYEQTLFSREEKLNALRLIGVV